ncbi:MAG TPA: glycosyltransferase [Pyrinomonadaceae bacterium]
MKSVIMIAWDFDPFYVRGGTAYAIRRLADQLTGQGIATTVLLPARDDTESQPLPTSLLRTTTIKIGNEFRNAPRIVQCREFCRVALETVEQTMTNSDAIIAHGDEAAMFLVMRNSKRSPGPSVFWLHSLYDPPIGELSEDQRRSLPSNSLLASAVKVADIVVTSTGVLQDAQEFEWPAGLKELQNALMTASTDQRILTVEAVGCLSAMSNDAEATLSATPKLRNLKQPYVLFPCRPTVDKGMGIFAVIAERLRKDGTACVAVGPPNHGPAVNSRAQDSAIQWLPWLSQDELQIAMRNAVCTVLPSITEGFGLAAAESASLGVVTLYQQVGGHHGLQSFPNAVPVALTTSERARLYQLWTELVAVDPDSWSVWSKYEPSFRPLIERWVEAIRSVMKSPASTFSAGPRGIAQQWGDRLRDGIEAGVKV